MKKKHKTYSRPKRPFDKARLEEEAKIKREFGLKNKKEIWKAESRVKSIREKAKKLIRANPEEQKALFDRLNKIGLNVNSIADVLGLGRRDYLNRRLQTIILKKKIANTPSHARQLIVHKKILVNEKTIDSPSYIVPIALENKITLKVKKPEKKEKPKKEETAQENNGELQEEKVEAKESKE